MPEIEIVPEPVPDRKLTILRLMGDIDANTVPKLEAAMSSLFASHQSRILVDLSEVNYISSAGAGVFVVAITQAQGRNGEVVLCCPSPEVREVLEILGLVQVLNVVDTREEGLKQFA